jgi:hypothetical protein
MERGTVVELLDAVERGRNELWHVAAARPQGAVPRHASRTRQALADAATALHELVRAMDRQSGVAPTQGR